MALQQISALARIAPNDHANWQTMWGAVEGLTPSGEVELWIEATLDGGETGLIYGLVTGNPPPGPTFTDDGVTISVSNGVGAYRQDQLAAVDPNPYNGTFAVGERLMLAGLVGALPPTVVTFGVLVKGVGFQWNANPGGANTYRITLVVKDGGGATLATYTQDYDQSTHTKADGSAPFIGAVYEESDSANIKSITLSVINTSSLASVAFAIGQLYFGPFSPEDIAALVPVVLADTITFTEELIAGDGEGLVPREALLCVPFNLLDCSGYTNPAEAAAVLPEIYGDFSTPFGLRGPLPAVCIDKANFVYAAASHAALSIDHVYVDDVLKTLGADYAINLAVNYEDRGVVAIIDFPSDPGGQVTWCGRGRMELDSSLITNPIRQLEFLLRRRGGFADNDLDPTTWAQARADCDAMGYQTAWVVQDTREIQQWLTEWLFNVMGFWRVDGRQRVQVMLDTGGAPAESQRVASIIASRDVVGGEDGVEMSFDRQHLVNALTVSYRWQWASDLPATRLLDFGADLIAARSLSAHGEARKAIAWRGHRDETTIRTLANVLFQRQGFVSRVEGAILSCTVPRALLAHAALGDVIAFTWAAGPTREHGNAYVNELLRIVALNHDAARGGRTHVRALDLGAFVSASEGETQGAYFDADDDDQYNAELFFGGGRLLVPLS